MRGRLAPRAAALRGDDYQHAVGWHWACRALGEPDIVSVSIEDPGGGYFDDVVVRRVSGPDEYWQVKNSNYGDAVIDEAWLTTSVTARGRSPLQHFYDTWAELNSANKPTAFVLLANRTFDTAHPIIGSLRDAKSEHIVVDDLVAASPGSAAGKTRKSWCEHLGVDVATLASFLNDIVWQTGGAEPRWDESAKLLMRLAGLRDDDEAVTVGRALVRSWVTDGAGPQTVDAIRRQVADKGLLARSGQLVFAVHAIDHQPSATTANIEVDFVRLYEGDDSFTRVVLRDEADWERVVKPALREAAHHLEAYATRHVHVAGSMRLPLWFAVGRELPDVRRWVLSIDQRDQEWSTDPVGGPSDACTSYEINVGDGAEVAVAVGITHDIAGDVVAWLRDAGLPVGTLLSLGPKDGAGPHAVPDAAWASSWVTAAREAARKTAETSSAPRLHLFFACPAAIALFLGHRWNMMPPTMVYEHIRPGYAPTITVA